MLVFIPHQLITKMGFKYYLSQSVGEIPH